MSKKKGLLAYDSRYGSTADVAFWIKAMIGEKEQLDVKKYNQVLTTAPYDYVIIGGFTRWEKAHTTTYDFVERNKDDLAQKEVAYFLTCGDSDETVVINMPFKPAHVSCGRSYLADMLEKYPQIKPVTTGGFGGRQVNAHLRKDDRALIWFLEHTMPKDKVGWIGRDCWESLVPARVEAFANDIRQKILSLPPRKSFDKYRGYWKSLQPGNLTDSSVDRFHNREWVVHDDAKRCYFVRNHIKSNLKEAGALLSTWASDAGASLNEMSRTDYNVYYQVEKNYSGEQLTIHAVIADFPEDPGNVHFSFRCYDKQEKRPGAEQDIDNGEELLLADGRQLQ
jgi:menaquinone-dependent protoporphyrinogen IX oxidase